MLDFTSWNYKNAPTAGDYCCPPQDEEEMTEEELTEEEVAELWKAFGEEMFGY